MKDLYNKMLNKLIHILICSLSKLKMNQLYNLAHLVNIINTYFIQYRLKTTIQNIQFTLPNTQEKNQKILIKRFYIYLFDLLAEIIKSYNLKKEDIRERVKIRDLSLIEDCIKSKKPLILMCSHCNNWEWLFLRLSLIKNVKLAAAYKPIKNTYFNKLLYSIRSKFGAQLIPLKDWKYFIKNNRNQNYLFMFLSDQVPAKKNNGKRIDFFNQSTLFDIGAERIAKLLNINAIYVETNQVKKGYYVVNFEKMKSNNLTFEYAQLLEKSIKKKPQNWLWSHNRWKR